MSLFPHCCCSNTILGQPATSPRWLQFFVASRCNNFLCLVSLASSVGAVRLLHCRLVEITPAAADCLRSLSHGGVTSSADCLRSLSYGGVILSANCLRSLSHGVVISSANCLCSLSHGSISSLARISVFFFFYYIPITLINLYCSRWDRT